MVKDNSLHGYTVIYSSLKFLMAAVVLICSGFLFMYIVYNAYDLPV